MTQNTGLLLARLPSYWPLIGCYRLNASHGQEYPEQRIASSPVSTHSLGLITIHCHDRSRTLRRPTQIITPPYVAHVRLLCACASSQVKLSVCCTECLGWGHDRLSYNTSPLIILIHITPGHETSRCCQQHCEMLLP